MLAVLTIPAAGSEQSVRCVISHHGTKAGIGAECLRPAAAIVNPECFMTLPRHQVAAGVVDMISHIMERYFTRTTATAYVDAQAEAAMRTAVEFGPKVWADASDYDAWCQIGMVGSFAHNGYFGLGREEDWACHAIEHEISGWNEAITHGMGLSVVIPAWMRYVSERMPERFAQFARNVFGIVEARRCPRPRRKGIEALVAFYKSIGMPDPHGRARRGRLPRSSRSRAHCAAAAPWVTSCRSKRPTSRRSSRTPSENRSVVRISLHEKTDLFRGRFFRWRVCRASALLRLEVPGVPAHVVDRARGLPAEELLSARRIAPVGGDVAFAALDEFVGNGAPARLFKGLDDLEDAVAAPAAEVDRDPARVVHDVGHGLGMAVGEIHHVDEVAHAVPSGVG